MEVVRRFYILLSWAFFIFVLISIPLPEYEGNVVTLYDKVIHAFMFGVFAYLLAYAIAAFREFRKNHFKLLLLLSLIISIGYSALSELIQNYVPGRTVSEYDFYAGVAGVLLLMPLIYARFRNKKA